MLATRECYRSKQPRRAPRPPLCAQAPRPAGADPVGRLADGGEAASVEGDCIALVVFGERERPIERDLEAGEQFKRAGDGVAERSGRAVAERACERVGVAGEIRGVAESGKGSRSGGGAPSVVGPSRREVFAHELISVVPRQGRGLEDDSASRRINVFERHPIQKALRRFIAGICADGRREDVPRSRQEVGDGADGRSVRAGRERRADDDAVALSVAEGAENLVLVRIEELGEVFDQAVNRAGVVRRFWMRGRITP